MLHSYALLTGYAVVNAIVFVVVLWGRGEVSAFLQAHPAIASQAELDRFKAMVRRQMLAVVTLLPLTLLSFIGAVYLPLQSGPFGVLTVIGTSIPVFIVARDSKGVELRARTLPCAREVSAEYAGVCHAWVKHLLPRF